MAVETSGKDARYSVNDTVKMTVKDDGGNLKTYTGTVTATAYGTAQQIALLWRDALARNAGDTGQRFFYKIRGTGFNPRRAYREETLEPALDV